MRRLAIALLPALLTVTLSSAAQAQATIDAVEGQIRSLEEQERTAVLAEDVPALERLWSPHLIVNTPQNELSTDRTVVFDRIRRGLIRYARFDRHIESIRIDGDVALVMGSETVVRKADDPAGNAPVHRRFTNIWKKTGTTWHVIARHASVIPGR
jgi:hypothetical protein